MTTFGSAAPAKGQTMLALAIHGGPPLAAVFPNEQHIEMLKGVEREFNLSRAARTDKAAQLALREKLYVTLHKHAFAQDAMKGAVAAVYWLAVNHFDRGEEIKSTLSKLLREEELAVITVMVAGDQAAMRWGFSVGLEATDLTDVMGETDGSTPIFLSLDEKPAAPLH